METNRDVTEDMHEPDYEDCDTSRISEPCPRCNLGELRYCPPVKQTQTEPYEAGFIYCSECSFYL